MRRLFCIVFLLLSSIRSHAGDKPHVMLFAHQDPFSEDQNRRFVLYALQGDHAAREILHAKAPWLDQMVPIAGGNGNIAVIGIDKMGLLQEIVNGHVNLLFEKSHFTRLAPASAGEVLAVGDGNAIVRFLGGWRYSVAAPENWLRGGEIVALQKLDADRFLILTENGNYGSWQVCIVKLELFKKPRIELQFSLRKPKGVAMGMVADQKMAWVLTNDENDRGFSLRLHQIDYHQRAITKAKELLWQYSPNGVQLLDMDPYDHSLFLRIGPHYARIDRTGRQEFVGRYFFSEERFEESGLTGIFPDEAMLIYIPFRNPELAANFPNLKKFGISGEPEKLATPRDILDMLWRDFKDQPPNGPPLLDPDRELSAEGMAGWLSNTLELKRLVAESTRDPKLKTKLASQGFETRGSENIDQRVYVAPDWKGGTVTFADLIPFLTDLLSRRRERERQVQDLAHDRCERALLGERSKKGWMFETLPDSLINGF